MKRADLARDRPLPARFPDGEFGVLLPPAWTPYLLLVLQSAAREFREKGTWIPSWFIDLEEAAVQAASGEVGQSVDLHPADSGASARGSHPTSETAEGPEWVTSERVAEVLGCTTRWARELIRRGGFPGARRVGRDWAVPPEALIRAGVRGVAALNGDGDEVDLPATPQPSPREEP